MYGVVLWTDQRENRAVIWCEDHGELAYYRGAAGGDAAMCAGDLVEFDVSEGDDMRLADLPRLVTRRSHPTLCANLKIAGRRAGVIRRDPPANFSQPADVIPLELMRQAACG